MQRLQRAGAGAAPVGASELKAPKFRAGPSYLPGLWNRAGSPDLTKRKKSYASAFQESFAFRVPGSDGSLFAIRGARRGPRDAERACEKLGVSRADWENAKSEGGFYLLVGLVQVKL